MTATLTPAAQFEEATTYQVTLTSAVRGMTGTFVVGTPVVWSFTTILVQPPAVTGHTPADGAQEQPVDVMVMISFDREMDRNTVTPDSFYIQKVGGDPLPAVLTCNGGVATLTPEIHLDPDTTYKVTLTGAVKSVKGASVVGAPITWTFKTKQMPLALQRRARVSPVLHRHPPTGRTRDHRRLRRRHLPPRNARDAAAIRQDDRPRPGLPGVGGQRVPVHGRDAHRGRTSGRSHRPLLPRPLRGRGLRPTGSSWARPPRSSLRTRTSAAFRPSPWS